MRWAGQHIHMGQFMAYSDNQPPFETDIEIVFPSDVTIEKESRLL